jgi:hypothetical protein
VKPFTNEFIVKLRDRINELALEMQKDP